LRTPPNKSVPLCEPQAGAAPRSINSAKLNNIASYPYPTQINVLITADLLTISRKKIAAQSQKYHPKKSITLRLAKQYFWQLFFSS